MRIISRWALATAAGVLLAARWNVVAAPLVPPPSRVVIVENPQATVAFEAQAAVVAAMVNKGIIKLTGKADAAQAWRSLVSTQDVVGLKVVSLPGPPSGTRPAVVAGVIEGLLQAGLPASNIIIWDNRLADLQLGFGALASRYGVRLEGARNEGYDENAFYDNELMGDLVWGDYEFDHTGAKTGRKSYVSQLLTKRITKIIPISPLLNHNLAGVQGHLYSLAMGSVDNTARFLGEARHLARAVPEIYALPYLSDHVVLCITDALIGQYEGQRWMQLHRATKLDQLWFSTDPVALDTLAIEELDRERQAANVAGLNQNLELYHNADVMELGTSDTKKLQIEMVK